MTIADALQVAVTHHQAGRFEQAERIYRQILEQAPRNADAMHLLGLLAHNAGRYELAASYMAQAITINPAAPFYHNNLGNTLQDLGRYSEAVLCYQQALRLDPDYVEAYSNLGSAYQQLGRHREALPCFEQALRRNPFHAESYNNLGNTFSKLGYTEDAVRAYRQAIECRRDYPDAHSNLGGALVELGDFEAAFEHLQEALRLEPANARAHWNRALLWLLLGDFARGWEEYEWRWHQPEVSPQRFPQPLWDGSPLDGRTLLLHAEQGLGDSIQFSRFVPLLGDRGGPIVVKCQDCLLPLLKTMPGTARWLSAGDETPPFDVHLPLMSLPRLLGVTVDSIPPPPPLQLEAARVEYWRRRMESAVTGESVLRVGICWSGSPQYKNNARRSVPLARLAPLGELSGLILFNLQRGPQAGELTQSPFGRRILDFEAENQGLMDTAAVIANLDLVITVDTMIAHLAATLGKTVWTLLAFVPDWRWLLGRADTPWYPTMRLFRQSKPGDWEGVVQQVLESLRHV